MAESTTTTCDGCGEVINTDENYIGIQVYGPFLPLEDYARRQDLHGIACIPLWLEKLPLGVRMALTDRAFVR